MDAITNLLSKNAKKIFQFGGLAFIALYFFYTLFYTIDVGFAFSAWLDLCVYAAIFAAMIFGVMKNNDQLFEVGAFTFAVYFGLASAVSYLGTLSNISFDNAFMGLNLLCSFFAGLGLAALVAVFFCGKLGKKLPDMIVPIATIVTVAFSFLAMIFLVIFMIQQNADTDYTPYSVCFIIAIVAENLGILIAEVILGTLLAPAEKAEAPAEADAE